MAIFIFHKRIYFDLCRKYNRRLHSISHTKGYGEVGRKKFADCIVML